LGRGVKCYGCAPDKVYALCEGSKVIRFSFSHSLLSYLRRRYRPGCELRRFTVRTGRELLPGQCSSTGLYAIMDRRKGKMLRIHVNRVLAEELTRCGSRYVVECGVLR